MSSNPVVTPAVPGVLAVPAAGLPVLKELSCPKCGSPIKQFLPSAQTVVCQACGSHISLGADGLGILGAGRRLPAPPVPIAIGSRATLQGETFVVLGRVLYEGHDPEDSSDTWQWNEWLLASASGRLLWLEFDEEDGYVLSAKIRLREAFNVQTDSAIPLGNGRKARVRERYPAHIVGAEGELTWQARCGDELTVIDAAGEGRRYAVEADAREIELYEGDALTGEQVAAAFGHQEWIQSVAAHHANKSNLSLAGRLCWLFALIGAVIGFLVMNSGTLLTSQVVKLTTDAQTITIPITITNAGRQMQVKTQVQGSLPANTAADMDITLVAPDATETVVLEHEFYHETGKDTGYEDGEYYSEDYDESDYAADNTFVPNQVGSHDLDVAWAPGTGVTSVSVKVDVYADHIAPTFFWIYAAAAAVLGLILIILGTRHTNPSGAPARARVATATASRT